MSKYHFQIPHTNTARKQSKNPQIPVWYREMFHTAPHLEAGKYDWYICNLRFQPAEPFNRGTLRGAESACAGQALPTELYPLQTRAKDSPRHRHRTRDVHCRSGLCDNTVRPLCWKPGADETTSSRGRAEHAGRRDAVRPTSHRLSQGANLAARAGAGAAPGPTRARASALGSDE